MSVTEFVSLRSAAAIRTPARNHSCLSYLQPPGRRRPSDRPSRRDLYHPTFDSEICRRPSDRPSRRDLYHPTFDSELRHRPSDRPSRRYLYHPTFDSKVPESLCRGLIAQSLRARYPCRTAARGDVSPPGTESCRLLPSRAPRPSAIIRDRPDTPLRPCPSASQRKYGTLTTVTHQRLA